MVDEFDSDWHFLSIPFLGWTYDPIIVETRKPLCHSYGSLSDFISSSYKTPPHLGGFVIFNSEMSLSELAGLEN